MADDSVIINTQPQSVIEQVQGIRLQMLLGNQVPEKGTLTLMKDLTGTALSQQRLAVDQGTNDAAKATAQLFAQILANQSGPILRNTENVQVNPSVPRTLTADQIPVAATAIEGETSTVMPSIALEDIMGADYEKPKSTQ